MRFIFPLSQRQRNFIYYFRITKLYAKHEKKHEFHLSCWDHVCKLIEWCLVDCFHRKAIFFAIQNIYVHLNFTLARRRPGKCGVK